MNEQLEAFQLRLQCFEFWLHGVCLHVFSLDFADGSGRRVDGCCDLVDLVGGHAALVGAHLDREAQVHHGAHDLWGFAAAESVAGLLHAAEDGFDRSLVGLEEFNAGFRHGVELFGAFLRRDCVAFFFEQR